MPVFYHCDRCTACCRWPGEVKITAEESESIAAFLGERVEAFIQKFTRLRHNRRGLALVERPNHECVFLDGLDCRIQPVKPHQCRGFPNLWNFPGFQSHCQATPEEVSDDQHARYLRASLASTPVESLPE